MFIVSARTFRDQTEVTTQEESGMKVTYDNLWIITVSALTRWLSPIIQYKRIRFNWKKYFSNIMWTSLFEQNRTK